MKHDIPSTPLRRILFEMAKYPEYETILDTPGLAFHFNEFVKSALTTEKLVLEHLDYMNKRKKRGPKRGTKKGSDSF